MEIPTPKLSLTLLFLLLLHLLFVFPSLPFCAASDASAMADLKRSLILPSSLKWSDPNPCNNWNQVQCDSSGRITRIQIGSFGVSGTLPSSLSNLTSLQVLELMNNKISGPLPSLAGLSSLQTLLLQNNTFNSIPPDFFKGMTSLQAVFLDDNPFTAWSIPDSLRDASSLQNFSANSANLAGTLPDFIGPNTFPSLSQLRLMSNHLEGELPATFSDMPIRILWLSGQTFINGPGRSLGGSIAVLQNLTELEQVSLNMNKFTGPIPDLSRLKRLSDLNLRDNSLTGPVPDSLTSLKSLQALKLTNNALQGPTPKFPGSVKLDLLNASNSFCSPTPGSPCDSRVDALILFLEPFGYPIAFAQNWPGNDPCSNWLGITCQNGIVSVVNLQNKGLTGSISPSIAKLTSIKDLLLAHNNITGTIPPELATMPNLSTLDVSYNQLYGNLPSFTHTNVITAGNVNIGKNDPALKPEPPSSYGSQPGNDYSSGKTVGIVTGVVGLALVIALSLFYLVGRRKKQDKLLGGSNRVVIHPKHSESSDSIKIAAAAGQASSDGAPRGDIHVIQRDSLVISIQVLRNVTNNFSESNILGRGGFGTVYKGELHDGTKIAVKRMGSGAIGDKGLAEFTSEITVLTKVRHRNLVALLGYCLDGNEKLLVYEYMPQGDLSEHLFSWKLRELKPLQWKRRLGIALDVARGVEYLHNLARESFIHRDLKPSNILIGSDLRAKVADFGLVRLAPNEGKASIQTRLAGTFGYLAPEYAVMGRVTTKVDVYSFGVILMELITGRKALDETQPDDSMHLVTWFRRTFLSRDALEKLVDPTIELNDETRASIVTVSELAGHCSARDPSQRPDMSHAVNVLSSLVDQWKPSKGNKEECRDFDFDVNLPHILNKWRAFEGGSGSISNSNTSSSFFGSRENTQTSMPAKPNGFADSFTSSDAR